MHLCFVNSPFSLHCQTFFDLFVHNDRFISCEKAFVVFVSFDDVFHPSPSTAIIAPRRMGKTVLLDRLVNTVFFKPEYRVAPFYFQMKREDMTLKRFLMLYAKTFFRQYIAYCLQEPALYSDNRPAVST